MFDIKEVVEAFESQRPVIYEPVFRSTYLPFFLGKLSPDQIKVTIAAWVVDVAGTSTASVDVIHPETYEVLFTVPPLIDFNRLTILDGKHFEYATALLSTYKQNRPELGEAAFIKEVRSALEHSVEIDHKNPWDAILQYYGYVEVPAAPKPKETNLLDDLGLTR